MLSTYYPIDSTPRLIVVLVPVYTVFPALLKDCKFLGGERSKSYPS